MALISNIPHLQPSRFCCIVLIFSAFLQDITDLQVLAQACWPHCPPGQGLPQVLTRLPAKAVVNAFQKCGREELHPIILFFFSVVKGWVGHANLCLCLGRAEKGSDILQRGSVAPAQRPEAALGWAGSRSPSHS